ncbi:sperm flagellar protein 2-like isoform X2 [Sitophilus oryzae]|nr:sperm flagellar protein 2-like isoform X2 [Sitophilus oryzae]
MEILGQFEMKINEGKAKSEDKVMTDILLHQSNYEKLVMSKMGQVKIQKEFMLENKFIQGENLHKLKDREFVNAMMMKNKDLKENKTIYYLEKDRYLELHRRIWNERLRLRHEREKRICSEAFRDISDIAVKIAEHKKKFGRDLDLREMGELRKVFVSCQPVFDVTEPGTQIIASRESFEDVEEIVTKEIDKQDAIDAEEFNDYVDYLWPWELKNVTITEENLDKISRGLNVLGHIIHQVLLAKHPLPPLPERPQFPDVDIRVCINGLNDMNSLPVLRNLLAHKKIEVVEMTQATTYCIEAFHEENRREYDVDVVPTKEKRKDVAPKVKEKGKKSKSKGKSLKSNDIDLQDDVEPVKTYENKNIQTPIVFPCEEIILSTQAALGKTAEELLNAGQPLTDFLLTAMLVEYLKSLQPEMKGWVLINYPTNFEQAAILEEAFTGERILNMEEYVETKSISELVDTKSEMDKDISSLLSEGSCRRHSTLMPEPYKPVPVIVYDTILTAYIKLKPLTDGVSGGESNLPPVFEESGANPNPLDKYYSDTGVNYSMYYKDFDFATIKYLGKLIIGDYSLPLKSSMELFGDAQTRDVQGEATRSVKSAKKGEKLKRPKVRSPIDKESIMSDNTEMESKRTKSEKKDKKSKIKALIVHEDKSVQVPEVDEEIEDILEGEPSQVRVPLVGEPDWQYVIVPVPEDYMIPLASIWESAEEIYTNDLKQLLFMKRTKMNLLAPFTNRVKETMQKFIDRPDCKGQYLAKFQQAFNAFDMDFRKDDEFKAEMHCRIADFKEKLTELCDEKMLISESGRCGIINANWAPKEIAALLNDFINMLQIEIDRYVQSVWLADNYFSGVFTNTPNATDIAEDNLPKIHSIDPRVVNDLFQIRDSEIDLSYFDTVLRDLIRKAHEFVKKNTAASQATQEKIRSSSVDGANKSKSKGGSTKSKASHEEKNAQDLQQDVVKERTPELLTEWQCAVEGETLRVLLRLDLIKHVALETIGEFVRYVCETFHSVFDEINARYRKEVESIESACRLFQTAVEKERSLQKELTFEGSAFHINSEVNLFENPPIVPDLPKEVVEKGAFTVSQLSNLVKILTDLCPSGYIPKTSFLYILQDIIVDESAAPPLWRRLDSKNLRHLIDFLFDDLEYLYWRDFIVYNLRVAFPDEKELLLIRKRLKECDPDNIEAIHDYQFFGTKLWFELVVNVKDQTKIKDVKELLFKMYSVDKDWVNYTALLLDFCKDESPLIGFAKALELSLGKKVCWDKDTGNAFTEQFMKNMDEHEQHVRLKQEEKEEYFKAVRQELNKLVDRVINSSDGVVITEINEESAEPRTKRPNRPKSEVSEVNKTPLSSTKDEVRFYDTDTDQPNDNQTSPDLHNQVDTEASDFTQIAFFLPLDVLITVITTALPWHCKVQYYEELSLWEQAAKLHAHSADPNFNGSVLTHNFLNSNEFLKLLGQTSKFTIKDPVRKIKEIFDECIE